MDRTPEEEEAVRQAMSIIGRSRSPAKAAAVRENGKRGGAGSWSEESRAKHREAQRARRARETAEKDRK